VAASNGDTLTDLERAGRFLYLQRLAFGGKVAGRSFGTETAGGARGSSGMFVNPRRRDKLNAFGDAVLELADRNLRRGAFHNNP
jgi:hypothetical protein